MCWHPTLFQINAKPRRKSCSSYVAANAIVIVIVMSSAKKIALTISEMKILCQHPPVKLPLNCRTAVSWLWYTEEEKSNHIKTSIVLLHPCNLSTNSLGLRNTTFINAQPTRCAFNKPRDDLKWMANSTHPPFFQFLLNILCLSGHFEGCCDKEQKKIWCKYSPTNSRFVCVSWRDAMSTTTDQTGPPSHLSCWLP